MKNIIPARSPPKVICNMKKNDTQCCLLKFINHSKQKITKNLIFKIMSEQLIIEKLNELNLITDMETQPEALYPMIMREIIERGG